MWPLWQSSNRPAVRKRKLRKQKRRHFERLELRQMLAADLIVDAPGRDVELQQLEGDLIQVLDRADNSIIKEARLADIADKIEISSRSFLADSDLSLAGNSLLVFAAHVNLTDSEIVTTDFQDKENAGALFFEAREINVLAGSRLDTQVNPDSSRNAGSITLQAVDRISDQNRFFQEVALPVGADTRFSRLRIAGARLVGREITLAADGHTLSRYDEVASYQTDIASRVIDVLQQTPQIGMGAVSPISGQVKIHEAASSIVIENSSISSSSWIEVDATAIADSSVNALTINGVNRRFMGSVGFSKSSSAATVDLRGFTSFDAASYIEVETQANSTAQTKTRSEGGSQFSAGDVDYAFNLALALTEETSIIDVGDWVNLRANGRINLDAQGKVINRASADTALFQDGEAAFSVAVGVDHADIRANVAGTITSRDAGNARSLSLAAGDFDAGSDEIRLTIPATAPLEVGERVVFRTASGAATGLVNEAEYLLTEVTDPEPAGPGQISQRVRLTRAASLPLDARQVPEESQHTFAKIALIEFPISAISTETSSGDGRIELDLPNGVQRITYLGPNVQQDSESEGAAEGIPGLTQNETYEAHRLGSSIKLRSLATGEFVDFSAPAEGPQHGFRYDESLIRFTPRDSVDHNTGRITLPDDHGLQTGDLLIYGVDAQRSITREIKAFDPAGNRIGKLGDATLPDAPIQGLQSNLAYRVIVDPHRPNMVRLARSLVHAELAQTADLQSVSVGAFALERIDRLDGIHVNAHLDATNFAEAGVNLGKGKQPWPALIQGATNGQIDDIAQFGFEFIDALRQGVDRNARQQAEASTDSRSNSQIDAAGSIAVAHFDHHVETRIGNPPIDEVDSRPAGLLSESDLSIQATIHQALKLGATAESTRNALNDAGGNGGNSGTGEYALGVAVGAYQNTAHTIVNDWARLDAVGDMHIHAAVDYPLLIDAQGSQHTLDMGLAGFNAWLSGNLDFANFTNVYARSIASGVENDSGEKVLAVGGGVAVTFTSNDVVVQLGPNARINRTGHSGPVQNVLLEAALNTSFIEVGQMMSVNLSAPGIMEAILNATDRPDDISSFLTDLVNPFGVSGDKAFGGSLIFNRTDNRVMAEVDSGASVRAAHLDVLAMSDFDSFAGVQTGTGSTEFGFSAAIAASNLASNTTAAIHNGARIDVMHLDVAAGDTLDRITYAGAVLKGEQTGVGTSIGINIVEQNVAAFVGREEESWEDDPTAVVPLVAPGAVRIAAEAKGTVETVTVSGALQGLGGSSADANSNQTGPIAITAPVAFNSVTTDVDAYLDNRRIDDVGTLEIKAHAATSTQSLVVGGSFAMQTESGANSGKLNLAGAGAVAINQVLQTVDATIHDSQVGPRGDVTVTATEASQVKADAGGLAIAFGSGPKRGKALSFGVSVAINDVSGHTQAIVDKSRIAMVSDDADLTVSAAALAGAFEQTSGSSVTGLALGGAASASLSPSQGTFGALGAAVQNRVEKSIRAGISHHSEVELRNGDVSVLALDESRIVADAGGLSLSGGVASKVNGALGIALAFNELENSTVARIADSAVSSEGAIVVRANLPSEDSSANPATVDALSVAGSLALAGNQGLSASLAGAGSGSNNQVHNTITAEIVESDVESFSKAIDVRAYDETTISATTVGAAIDVGIASGWTGTVAVGVAIARNEIDNATNAQIEASTVFTADHEDAYVNVQAADDAEIKAVAVAASLAVSAASAPAFSLSGGGSEASNVILSDVDALLQNSEVASASLWLASDSSATIRSDVVGVMSSVAGSAAAGASASIGASVANNFVGYRLDGGSEDARSHARVMNSSVDVAQLMVESSLTQDIDANTFVGAYVVAVSGGAGAAAAGSGTQTINRIGSFTLAEIAGDSAETLDVSRQFDLRASDETAVTSNTTATTVAAFLATGAGGAVQVGISLAQNAVDNRVEALLTGATLNGANAANLEVNVTAQQSESSRIDASSVAVSVSAAAAGGVAGSVSAAGASSVNTVANKTLATIRDSHVQASSVNVTADSRTEINATIANASIAPGFSVGSAGGLALGINDAHNVIGDTTVDRSQLAKANQVIASIEGESTIYSTGSVSVEATNHDTISAAMNASTVSAAGSPGLSGGVAGAGTAVFNNVASEVVARVAGVNDTGRIGINSDEDLHITASDQSSVQTIVGAVAVSAAVGVYGSGASISVSQAESEVSNLVAATIEYASINASGDIAVRAVEQSDIDTYAFTTSVGATFAIGGNLTGGGAVAYGRMQSQVRSKVASSELRAGAEVSVTSQSTSEVDSDTKPLGVSVVGLAANGSVPTAIVAPTVESLFSFASVQADELRVETDFLPVATADAAGFQVAVGATVGASDSTVQVGGRVIAAVSTGTKLVDVGRLSINSRMAPQQSGGNPIASFATANASSGGILLGTNSAFAESIDRSYVSARIGDGSSNIQVGDASTVRANSTNLQRAESDAYSGGVIGAGVPTATVENNLTTKATIGTGVSIDGGTLEVIANGRSNALSDANAGTGGIAAGSITQSKVDNRSLTEAGIGVSAGSVFTLGILNVDSLTIDADFLTQTNAVLGAVAGGVLSGQGGFVTNDVHSSVSATVGNQAEVTANRIDIDARQHVAKPDLGDAGNVDATTGGLVTGGGVGSHTKLVLNTEVNVGESARLRAIGGAEASLDLTAANSIRATDRLTARAGGVGAQAHVDSSMLSDQMHARVIIAGGAFLESTGTIDIDATGTANAKIQANSDAYGAVTIGSGSAEITLRPNNRIELQGNAVVRADRDVSLTAGIDTFDGPNYDLEARMDTFGGSLIPLEFIDGVANVFENNTILVRAAAAIESGGNVGLLAERYGINQVEGAAVATNWVTGLDGLISGRTAEGGVEQATGAAASQAFGTVIVDGQVRTGIRRQLELTIDSVRFVGDPENDQHLQSPDFYQIDATGNIPFEKRLGLVESRLHDDVERAKEQLSRYSDNAGLRAFYEAEVERLEEDLRAQGLLSQFGAEGDEIANQQSAVVLVFQDVLAQAGRIDIRGDRLEGSGRLNAPGDATIAITNNSLAFLQFSGMHIADSNGGVRFNSLPVAEAGGGDLSEILKAIRSENSFHPLGGNVAFAEVIGSAGSDVPSIVVNNAAATTTVDGETFAWPNIHVIDAPDDERQSLSGLRNLNGRVELKNPRHGAGSIVINAPITAAELVTVAGNRGTATISLPGATSIYEVGSSEFAEIHTKLYDSHTHKGIVPLETAAGTNGRFTTYLDTEPTVASVSAGRVFIEAHYINVNGLIQSGTSDYRLTIDGQVAAEIAAGIARGESGIQVLDTQPSSDFSLSYDYDRERIVVSELTVTGGYVELTGNIANTRQGEIRVFGGYADIAIDNQTDHDIELKRIDASRRGEGKVIINDLGRGDGITPEVYHYFRKGDLVEQSRFLLNGEVHHELFELNDPMIYLPKPGLRYGWTVARDSSTVEYYTYRSSSWLGAIDAFAKDKTVVSHTPRRTLNAEVHGSGAYFYMGSATNGPRYTYSVQPVNAAKGPWVKTNEWTRWTGWFLWAKKHHYTQWKQTTKNLDLHKHSIRADRVIDIDFTGHDEAKIHVQSKTGRVFVDGALVSPTGSILIDAYRIEQASETGLLQARQIRLNARTVGTEHAPVLTDVNDSPSYDLSTSNAIQDVFRGQRVFVSPDFAGVGEAGQVYESLTTRRAVDLGAEDFYSGDWIRVHAGASLGSRSNFSQYIKEVSGDLPVEVIAANTGDLRSEADVHLESAGGIIVGSNSSGEPEQGRVAAYSIDLIATRGDIGRLAMGDIPPQPLNVHTGVGGFRISLNDRLTAFAAGDIVMHHPGDVVVNEIRAGGVVQLSSAGDIIDGNLVELRDERAIDLLRTQVWADLRLTEGLGASARRQERIDSLEQSRTRDYHSYWLFRNTQDDPASYNTEHRVALVRDELDYYVAEFRREGEAEGLSGEELDQYVADRTTTLENNRTLQYHQLHPRWGPLGDVYDSAYEYQASAEDERSIDDSTKVWTEDELLNTSRPGEVLEISDTEFVIEDANVSGSSVTITEAQSIGQYQNGTTIRLQDELGVRTTLTLDERAAILTAEPNDLIYLAQEPLYTELVLFDNQIRYQQLIGDRRVWSDFGFAVGQFIYLEGNTRDTTDEGVFYEILALDGPLMTVDLEGKTQDGQFERVASTKMHIAPVVASQNFSEASFLRVLRREDLDVATDGIIHVTSQRHVFLGSEGDLRLGQVRAGDDRRVQIKTHGDLSNASGTELPMINGQRVVLESSIGSIGSAEVPLRLDLTAGGYLIARADEAVVLEQTNAIGDADDLSINQLFSRKGVVSLTADGSILDFFGADGSNVRSQALILYAGGSIGTTDNPLEINLGATGTLTAVAQQDIVITETAGDLNLRQVLSHVGDVILAADISILDVVDVEDANDPKSADSQQIGGLPRTDIVGRHITLTANLGSIGSVGNEIDIDSRSSAEEADGIFQSHSGANTYVIETNGDLYLGRVETNDETAFIAASGGSIYSGLMRDEGNVLGGKLWLFAADDIGTLELPLESYASAIEGMATAGSVFIRQRRSGEIGGVFAAANGEGESGSRFGNGLVAGQNITFTTDEQLAISEAVQVAGDVWISARAGLSLADTAQLSGNDIRLFSSLVTVSAGAKIQGEVRATLQGWMSSETQGATMLISGNLDAPTISIRGSSGDDDIRTPLTSKSGDVFISGLAGDDNIVGSSFADTIRGDLGEDTIDGGLGCDGIWGGGGLDTYLNVEACDTIGTLNRINEWVEENAPLGTVVGQLTMDDLDPGDSLSFRILDEDSPFAIDEDRLVVANPAVLNRAVATPFLVTIAADHAQGGTTTETLQIRVRGSNEAPFEIQLSSTRVAENDPGAIVGTLTVRDPDFEDQHSIAVSDARFEVVDGQLRLKPDQAINYELEAQIDLHITATDLRGLSTEQSFGVDVLNANDPPMDIDLVDLLLLENLEGMPLGTVQISDEDIDSIYELRVDNERLEFQGSTLRLKPGEFLSRSQAEELSFSITVIDQSDADVRLTQQFQFSVQANGAAWQNSWLAMDVNRDGFVTPIDALLVVNALNSPSLKGSIPLSDSSQFPTTRDFDSLHPYFDTSGDGYLSPIDVLLVVNRLNQRGEGEADCSFPDAFQPPSTIPWQSHDHFFGQWDEERLHAIGS